MKLRIEDNLQGSTVDVELELVGPFVVTSFVTGDEEHFVLYASKPIDHVVYSIALPE